MSYKKFSSLKAARDFENTPHIPGFWFISNDSKTIVWFATTALPPAYKVATNRFTKNLDGKVGPLSQIA